MRNFPLFIPQFRNIGEMRETFSSVKTTFMIYFRNAEHICSKRGSLLVGYNSTNISGHDVRTVLKH